MADPRINNLPQQPALPAVPSAAGDLAQNLGKAVELSVQQTIARALSEILKPGQIVTGRVIDRLTNGSYLFGIRGQTVVAESSVPLLRDSAVEFEVLSVDDQLRLRVVDRKADATVATSSFAARLAQVGLPAEPRAQQVLAAFEEQQAPLQPERLQAAFRQVRELTEAQARPIIAAQARLAQAGLPVTPATQALAERAAQPQLPNVAQAVRQAQQELTRNFPASATENEPAPPAPAVATAAKPPISTPTQSSLASGAPNISAQPTVAPAFAPRNPIDLGKLLSAIVNIAIPDPGVDGAEAVEKALEMVGVRSTPVSGADSSSTRPKATLDPGAEIARAPAHARAAPERIMAQLADAASHPTLREAAHASESEGIKTAIRELAAETVFKPSRLKDYDLVLPLPLQDHGQPTPARLAIAHRRASNGVTATYVRVDAELSNLGPLSIRMRGGDGTALGIHIFATQRARESVTRVIPDLQDKFNESGIVASIRVSDFSMDTEDDHGD